MSTGTVNESISIGTVNKSMSTGTVNKSMSTGTVNESMSTGTVNESISTGTVNESMSTGTVKYKGTRCTVNKTKINFGPLLHKKMELGYSNKKETLFRAMFKKENEFWALL